MTKEELLKRLKEIDTDMGFDPEVAHIRADETLLKYINDSEVTKAFEEIRKWYA